MGILFVNLISWRRTALEVNAPATCPLDKWQKDVEKRQPWTHEEFDIFMRVKQEWRKITHKDALL